MESEKVLSLIREEDLVDLLTNLIDIPSMTGKEEGVGNFVLDWLARQDIESHRQEVESGRINAVGVIPGEGGGASLQFNSHMDTTWVASGGKLLDLSGSGQGAFQKAVLKGDKIYGEGVVNCKGPLACFLIAGKAIRDSGVKLKGAMVMAGVCGEIGRAQVDEFSGPSYRSKGLGTRHLLTHGFATDYAIVAEPSQFTVTWALPGTVYMKISVGGHSAYTPFTDRGRNSIMKMAEILTAIDQWANEYEQKNIYRFARGEIHPKLNIGAVRGGFPFKPNHAPPTCSVYVDIRTPPGRNPNKVAAELGAALKPFDVKVEVYLARRGYEATGVDPLVASVDRAHEKVFGSPPANTAPGYTSMWNDNNIYSELGIPSVKIGPSPRDAAGNYDYNYVSDLMNAARIYALTALDICNSPSPA